MKKMIALLLVLVLIGLCACTSPPQNGQSPQNNPEKSSENAETPNAPTASTILRFAINPEFALHLDEAQNILFAEAENEDAKALFAQLDLAGKPYAEAITAILDAAYTQGYLKEGSEISITIDMPQSADSSLAFIKLPISAFEREKGITTSEVVNLSTDSEPKQGSVVIDGRKYNVSTEPLYGENSTSDNLVEVGTITKYICKRLTEEDDPTSYSKKEIAQFFNGDTWVTYYHNDSVLRRVDTYANGDFSDISYYPDGSDATYYTSYANGDFTYIAHAEDGTLLEEEDLMDGEYISNRQQEDGSYRYYNEHADGSRSEGIYSASGAPVYTADYYPNGDSTVITYFDNGTLKTQEEMLNGIRYHETFDENGTIIRVERTEADGSRTETIFDSSGNQIAWREYDAGGTLIDSFEEEPAS